MTRRAAALLLTARPNAAACPPGVDPDRFAGALAEDVAEVLADLAEAECVVVTAPGGEEEARRLSWPRTPTVVVPAGAPAADVLAALTGHGYTDAVLVAPDAPDLPGLLVAKPLSALTSRAVAVAPAEGGGLVALGSRLPAPPWLVASGVGLDTPDPVPALRAAAPRPAEVAVTPGWRRLRSTADLRALDPRLEGWETTRALLHGWAP